MARILAELKEENQLLEELDAELHSLRSEEQAYPRALASIFHDFYSGVERFFRKIAQELNGGLPGGQDWHRELLHDMTLDIPGLRPPVIRKETEERLFEFLRFRHVFRNHYGFALRRDRLELLRGLYQEAYQETRRDLDSFLQWLAAAAVS